MYIKNGIESKTKPYPICYALIWQISKITDTGIEFWRLKIEYRRAHDEKERWWWWWFTTTRKKEGEREREPSCSRFQPLRSTGFNSKEQRKPLRCIISRNCKLRKYKRAINQLLSETKYRSTYWSYKGNGVTGTSMEKDEDQKNPLFLPRKARKMSCWKSRCQVRLNPSSAKAKGRKSKEKRSMFWETGKEIERERQSCTHSHTDTDIDTQTHRHTHTQTHTHTHTLSTK